MLLSSRQQTIDEATYRILHPVVESGLAQPYPQHSTGTHHATQQDVGLGRCEEFGQRGTIGTRLLKERHELIEQSTQDSIGICRAKRAYRRGRILR